MKKKNVTLALSAFLMFACTLNLNAQDTTTNNKQSFGTWLTKTPWTIGFGMDVIDDNDNAKTFVKLRDFRWSPYKFTMEKALKKGLSVQLAFASTSYHPHNFLSVDLNGKYDLNNLIGETKWFDPYVIAGLGYTYRDYTENTKNTVKNVSSTNMVNFNVGLGANFWIYPNVGIQAQGLAKLTKNCYAPFSLGLVFKIGNCEAPKCEATPKTQEAQDALQHLRGIINK